MSHSQVRPYNNHSTRKLSSTLLLTGLVLIASLFVPHPAGAVPSTTCTPPLDFKIDATPDLFTLGKSATATSTITITPRNGFGETVTLSTVNVPADITNPTFSVSTVDTSAGPQTSTLTFGTSSTISPDTYSFDVDAKSGQLDFTVSITVKVPAPEIGISADKFIVILQQGEQASAIITVKSLYGFSGVVDLTTTVSNFLFVPPTPPTATLSSNTIDLTVDTQGTSTLNIATSASATPGSYLVKVIGTESVSGATNSTSVLVQVQGPDFSIDSKPMALTVPPGSTITATLEVNGTMGFSGTVALTTEVSAFLGTPPTVTLGTNSLALATNDHLTTTITVDASPPTSPGLYFLNVTGTRTLPPLGHWTLVLINVAETVAQNGFSLAPNPASLTIDRDGASKTSQITVKSNNLADRVDLSVSCYPEEITASLNPGSVDLTSGGSATATLTVSASQFTTPGIYDVSIIGAAANNPATNETSVEVIVTGPDFTLNAKPSSLSIQKGNSATSAISYTGANSFTGTVDLGASVVGPSGITATLNPASISSAQTSALTVAVDNTVSAGTYGVFVVGTSGSLVHSVPVVITVTAPSPDFTISASQNTLSGTVGSIETSTITVSPANGFSSDVILSTSVDPASGLAVSLSSGTIAGGTGTSTASFTSSATGFYTVTITAAGGGLTKTTTVQVTVSAAPDFTINATPSTLSFTQGTTATSTISFTQIAGWYSPIALSASVSPPTGLIVSFSPATSPYGTTFSLATFSSDTPGTYTVTITGTGTKTHSTTVQVTVTQTNTPDFSVTPSLSTLTITAGSSKTATITIAPRYGFTGTVTMSSPNQPSGITASFNPSSVAYVSGTSTLTVSIGSNVAPGSYLVTVTGTSGDLSHSASITITVTSQGQTANNPNNRTILGLEPNTFYTVVGVIAALLVAGVGVALRMRRPKTRSSKGIDSDWASR